MKNSFVYDAIKQKKLNDPFFEVNFSETYSQCSEDLIVLSLIKAYSLKNNIDIKNLNYLEVGANHPISTSSTYLFYKNYGMRGVLVEANPELISDLEKIRNEDTIVNLAVSTQDVEKIKLIVPEANELATIDPNFLPEWRGEGASIVSEYTVGAIHINALFDEYFKTIPPFYLTIDTEGNDIEILKQIDFSKNRPFIIQVEPSEHYNSNAFLEINEILTNNNYIFISKTDVNLIYFDKKDYFLQCYNKYNNPSTIVLGSSVSEIFDYIFGDNPNYYPFWIDGWTARGLWKPETQDYIRHILKDIPRKSSIFLNFGTADITVSLGYIFTKGEEFNEENFNEDTFINQCIYGINTTINTLKAMNFENIYTFFYSPIPEFPQEYWDAMGLLKQPPIHFLDRMYQKLLDKIQEEGEVINLIPLFSRESNSYIASKNFQRDHYDHHLDYTKIQDIIWQNIKTLPGIIDRRQEFHTSLYEHSSSHVMELINSNKTRTRTCR